MKLTFLLSTTFLLAPLAALHADPAAPKPNVVFILADDLGYSDLSALERNVGPPYALPDAIKKLGPGEVNLARPSPSD